MAHADRVKISRKDLRQPDEFQTLTAQAADWLRDNQSMVVGALSAVLAVGALVLGVGWYNARQATTATARMQTAHDLYAAKKFAEAATEFQAVATEYPRTPAGRIAVLYRGHALLQQPDATAAVTAYTEYLAGTPQTEYLRQEALLDLGRAHESAANPTAALDAYRQAGDLAGPFRTEAKLSTARLQEAAGDTGGARTIYAELLKATDLDPATRTAIAAKVPDAAEPTGTAPDGPAAAAEPTAPEED